MCKENDMGERGKVRRIWIGEAERIASFHAVDDYRLQIVHGHEDYVELLQSLQEQGFRFQ